MFALMSARYRQKLWTRHRDLSKLTMAHPAFVTHEFIDAASIRLAGDKNTTLGDITAYLDVYKDKMSSSNMVNFLNKVGRRKLLRPYHIFVVASGLQSHAESTNGLSLNEIDQIVDSLKYFPATVGSVRVLLSVVTESLRKSEERICSRQVGSYMLALRNMRSGHLEVREYISVLASKIELMDGEILADDFAIGFEGVQLLSSDYDEVVQLVAAVREKVAPVKDGFFNPGQVGRCLLGFQRLNMADPSVSALLSTVLDRVDVTCYVVTSREEMEQLCIAAANLANGYASCERLAKLLRSLISTSKESMPHAHGTRAITALKAHINGDIKNHPALNEVLEELESKMKM